MAEKIGSIIIDLQGSQLSVEERELLDHPLIGGVILFTRNYESLAQLQNLCEQIRATVGRPCLIMVDQEGGRVQRFEQEFARLPEMAVFGKYYDQDASKACHAARICGWLMAKEVLTAGLDLSLAPVLDLNKGISGVIGSRAFHGDRQRVLALAKAFVAGMREAGMAATGKHFPGHGAVIADSHVAIPVDERSLSEIAADDMQVFAGMIQEGLPAVMAAHIIFPQIDKVPVGFSARWLQEILRKQLGFAGVIFSDDLNMEGANIAVSHADRALAAREAGCDFVLLCNNRNGVIDVLDHLPLARHCVEKSKWGVLQGNAIFRENENLQEAYDLLASINMRIEHATHS